MTRRPRVVLAVAVAAVAVALVPSAALAEFQCPEGWYERPTSVTHPTTGDRVYYCWPMS